MRAKKPLSIQYCAADFLAGTVTLSPLAELAYRRICDLIYNCGDRLGHSSGGRARDRERPVIVGNAASARHFLCRPFWWSHNPD